jgi:phosphohistidine phosphatase
MQNGLVVKRLLLLRHAKSSWDDPHLADHDRPLAPRGRRAAKSIAAYMKEKGYEPSIVLCSSALRARQTLELITPALPSHTKAEIDPSIYHAGTEDLMTRLRSIPPEVPSVMLVGHNPAMHELLLTLLSDTAQVEPLKKKFPTAALAVLDGPRDWEHLGPAAAALIDYATPKQLEA